MSSISRRDLLKNAAVGSAAVAALGMAGVASADEAAPAAGQHSWEVKPEPIEDGTIAGLMEDAQSPEFDVIAGATLTCNGAAEALTNALTQAAE